MSVNYYSTTWAGWFYNSGNTLLTAAAKARNKALLNDLVGSGVDLVVGTNEKSPNIL